MKGYGRSKNTPSIVCLLACLQPLPSMLEATRRDPQVQRAMVEHSLLKDETGRQRLAWD